MLECFKMKIMEDYHMSNNIENHNVLLVTGASSGIGHAVVKRGAEAGYSIAVHYNRNREEAEAVVHSLISFGCRAIAIRADISEEKDVISMFDKIDKELGAISALVNNAGGIIDISSIADIRFESLKKTLLVNLAGPIICSREAIKRMSTKYGGKGGAIVNISSMAAVLGGLPNEVHYAASKGGVDSFTIGLAREVATEGIRVNAVRPGVIDTPIHVSHGGKEFLKDFSVNLPMKRPGLPSEVAESVIWLLSPYASYVTGSILNVSGGR